MLSDKTHPCEGCGGQIRADFALCEICAGVACEADDKDRGVDAGERSGLLSLSEKRRYAKAKSVLEVGIWSAKSPAHLFEIMIGSTAGVRNSYSVLRRDNRKLRFELKRMGLDYNDGFSGELSPDSHEFVKRDGTVGLTKGKLWHMHGVERFEDLIKARDYHSLLSPLWGKIHGSEVVDVKIITDIRKAVKYVVKEVVKSYLTDDGQNKRMMISKGWCPAGYRKVDRVLTKWALYHRYDWDNEQGEPEQGFSPRLEYIPEVWLVKRDYLRRWCQGESVNLDLGDYKAYIIGDSINLYAVKKRDDAM